MKLLIVDNEQHVIDAVNLLVNWEAFPFQEVMTALDGDEAVKLVEEKKPDVVLTDMQMPNMHGMKLIEWLSQFSPRTKIIVISGYSDFNYIQHTIRYGGLDYITKPIDKSQLETALHKAVDTILKERQDNDRNKEYHIASQLYWEKMLGSILEAPEMNERHLETFSKQFGINKGVKIRFAKIKLHKINEGVRRQFETDIQLLYFALKNICNEIMDNQGIEGIAYANEKEDGIIGLFLWGVDEGCIHVLGRMAAAIYHTYKIEVIIGLSEIHGYPEGLSCLLNESSQALRHRNIFDRQRKVFEYDPASVRSIMYLHMNREDFLIALKSHNSHKIRDLLNHYLDQYRRERFLSVHMMEHLIAEYELDRAFWVSSLFEVGARAVPVWGYDPETEEEPIEGLYEAIITDLQRLMSLADQYGNSSDNVISSVKVYIEHHYDERLSLKSLSDEFYLSKEHLSRKFKKEAGGNITEYITNVRMKKAKELLGNRQMTVKDVASMVGFEDEKYFSKVFRKVVGLSPLEYRRI